MGATVTLTSGNGTTLTVGVDDSSPVLSDGVTQWEVDARPKRTSITRYTGRLPWKQDIAVIFDGYMANASKENDIAKLERMETQPQTINLSGHALHTDLDWVIMGVDWDNQNTIWSSIGGHAVRVRQHAVIHFLERVEDTIIKTPAQDKTDPAKAKKQPTKKVNTPVGMTIKAIAAKELGNADKWKTIVDDNIFLPSDPRYVVPAGTILTIPNSSGKLTVFKVP